MRRLAVLLVSGVLAMTPALAATAPQPAPAAPAAPPSAPVPDLWTVAGVKIDATAESATIARDQAMAQGRPEAWAKIYRRLTAMAQWPKQPMLDDNRLLRLVRSFEVVNERRSTTRYLAEVTYHFNPAAVRAILRAASIPYTEARSRPALVIPVTAGKGFDPASPWATAWANPALSEGLVPVVLPQGDTGDIEALVRPDAPQLDWANAQPVVARYGASEVILATASEDGKSFQVVRISATARVPSSFAFAQPNYDSVANAVVDQVNEAWKTRSAVNYGARARLVADVQFDTLQDWAKIRSGIGAVRAIADMDVHGLMLHEAEVEITYYGRPEQLRDAMAQQNLSLSGSDGNYTLALGGRSANAQ